MTYYYISTYLNHEGKIPNTLDNHVQPLHDYKLLQSFIRVTLITLLHPQWLIASLYCLNFSHIIVTSSQKPTRRVWFLSIQTCILSLIRITFPWSFIAPVDQSHSHWEILPLLPFSFSNLHHMIFIRHLWLSLSI